VSKAIRKACGAKVANNFNAVNDRRANGAPDDFAPTSSEFYEFVSTMPLIGLVHSWKRTFITDVAAYVSALVQHLGTEGPILDVGCHAGYHCLWLAQHHCNPVRGMDSSRAAIRFACEKAKELGVSGTFDSAKLADGCPAGGYDLIFASDGLLTFSRAHLDEVYPLLREGGLFGLFEDDCPADTNAFKSVLDGSGFGVELLDVIGGLTREGFEAKTAMLLSKGGVAPLPDDPMTNLKALWYQGFQDYCNTAGRPPETKTIGQF